MIHKRANVLRDLPKQLSAAACTSRNTTGQNTNTHLHVRLHQALELGRVNLFQHLGFLQPLPAAFRFRYGNRMLAKQPGQLALALGLTAQQPLNLAGHAHVFLVQLPAFLPQNDHLSHFELGTFSLLARHAAGGY